MYEGANVETVFLCTVVEVTQPEDILLQAGNCRCLYVLPDLRLLQCHN